MGTRIFFFPDTAEDFEVTYNEGINEWHKNHLKHHDGKVRESADCVSHVTAGSNFLALTYLCNFIKSD